MTPQLRGVWLYARTHRALPYALGTAACCALLPRANSSAAGLGSIDGHGSTAALAAMLFLLGTLAGGTWTSRAHGQDRLLTDTPALVRIGHGWVVTLLSAAATGLTTAVFLTPATDWYRTVLPVGLWAALSLCSSVLLTSAYSWVLPLAYFLVTGAVGFQHDGSPASWNLHGCVSTQGTHVGPTLAVTLLCLLMVSAQPARA